MYMQSYDNSTAVYKFLKTYTLAGFEPGIYCSVGGRDDHYVCHAARAYATQPGQFHKIIQCYGC
jgi:hypothetical protein